MIRILLISPIDPKVPGNLKYLVGGENTYTRTLLAYPPKGVRYVHFEDAISSGQVEYLPLNKILWFLVKLRILPLSSGSRCLRLKSRFDLVHCHSFSIKISGQIAPIVLSDSSSNYLFLHDYVNWPQWRIKLGYFLRKQLFGLLGVVDADTNPEGARKVIVFSQFAQKLHKKLGVPESKMVVAQPGLQVPSLNVILRSKTEESKQRSFASLRMTIKKRNSVAPFANDYSVNILFVGVWFERKGGPLLLEAFERLSGKYPNVRLTIVGDVPEKFTVNPSIKLRASSPQLTVYKYVPREKLMSDFFSKADIFVLVPPKVEGYGFAVLEAMSFGIPVVVSNVCALPELVEDGKSGYVIKPGSVEELTKKLENLISNQALREKMGMAARKRFLEKFEINKSNNKLLKVYERALR